VTGTLVTSSYDRQDHIEEAAPGVKMIRLNVGKKKPYFWTADEVARYLVRAPLAIKEALRREHFDICHSFFGFPCGLLAWRIRKELPYIIFLTGVDVPGEGTRLSKLQPFLLPVYKRVWGKAGALVANSADLKERALKAFPDMDIKVIHNGVDTAIFSPAEKIAAGQKLLTVARLQKHKNIHLIIEALAGLKSKYPEISFKVVGDGPESANLKELISKNNLESSVELLGYKQRSEMPDIYRAANCFLLPSAWEGMSNGLLEAMASGLPVIVSDVGGARQLVKGNGVILPEISAAAIGDALCAVYEHKEKPAEMGQKSRQIAETLSSKKAAEKVYELSEKVI
jgi:glycosyltransferase involved in cell wall biosynthesis